MKHRIIIFLILLSSFFIMFYSKWLKFPEQIGLCLNDFMCEEFWIRGVFWPINESIIYLISSLTILIFFPYTFLKTWLKIMIPYAIVAFIIVSLTAPLCSGMICFDRTLVASGLSKIFLILTIIILLIKSIYLLVTSKRKSKK